MTPRTGAFPGGCRASRRGRRRFRRVGPSTCRGATRRVDICRKIVQPSGRVRTQRHPRPRLQGGAHRRDRTHRGRHPLSLTRVPEPAAPRPRAGASPSGRRRAGRVSTADIAVTLPCATARWDPSPGAPLPGSERLFPHVIPYRPVASDSGAGRAGSARGGRRGMRSEERGRGHRRGPARGRHAHRAEPEPAERVRPGARSTPPAAATSRPWCSAPSPPAARKAGAAGTAVVPDLATDIGKSSRNATVWTYHLKPGLKYEDGTAITSADIKYGIERSFAPELSGGAPYLRDWLSARPTTRARTRTPRGCPPIETPDARTIVFHLDKPEGDFPYLATQTQFTPVPKAKDTGTKYQNHPVSSGPYEVVRNENDGATLTLKRNPYWSSKTDDQRHAHPRQDRRPLRPRPGRHQPAAVHRFRRRRRGGHHRHQPGPGRTGQGRRRQGARLPSRHRPLRLHRLHRLQPRR